MNRTLDRLMKILNLNTFFFGDLDKLFSSFFLSVLLILTGLDFDPFSFAGLAGGVSSFTIFSSLMGITSSLAFSFIGWDFFISLPFSSNSEYGELMNF